MTFQSITRMFRPMYVDSNPQINRALCITTRRHAEVRIYDAKDGLESAIPLKACCVRCGRALELRPLTIF